MRKNGIGITKNIDTRIGSIKMNLFKNLKKFATAILVLSCGCNTVKWKHPKHYEWKAEERIDGGWQKENKVKDFC